MSEDITYKAIWTINGIRYKVFVNGVEVEA